MKAKATDAQIHSAFGANAVVAKVKDCIDKMASADSKFLIPEFKPEDSGVASVKHGTQRLVFGDFWSKDAAFQAFTLVHEASHAFCNTVDWFEASGKPFEGVPPKDKTSQLLSGCEL
jgi:hypothetical protein